MLSQKPKYIPTYLEQIPGINRNGPFVADVMCVLPHLRLDITGNYTFTNSGSTPIKTGLGPGMNVAASEYIQTVENFSGPDSGSLIVYFNPSLSGTERIIGYDTNWEIGYSFGKYFCDIHGSNSTRISSQSGWNVLVCSWSSDGSNRRLRNWLNGDVGVDVTESATAVSANNLSLGTRTGQTNGLNGDMLLFAMSSRELSEIEGRRLSADPWSIFQPSRIRGSRILPFGVGAGTAGTTINPDASSISIAGQSVSAVTNATPIPDEGSMSIVGQDVTLSFGLSPEAGSLSISGFEPQLNFTLLPANASISIAGVSVSVDVGSDVNLSPENATIAIAGQETSAITNSIISPANGSLSIAGSDLEIGVDVTLVPGVATISIDGQLVDVDAVFLVDGNRAIVTVVVRDIINDVIFETVN